MAHGADFVAPTELSLTGYEPWLAKKLAIDLDDPRLQPFQQISDAHHVRVAVGVPMKRQGKPRIGLVQFQPRSPRGVYSKQCRTPMRRPSSRLTR